eukprot:1151180-Pelagomonas_calceolata.AAC.3
MIGGSGTRGQVSLPGGCGGKPEAAAAAPACASWERVRVAPSAPPNPARVPPYPHPAQDAKCHP